MNEYFRRFANWSSTVTGSPWAFLLAVFAILAWVVTGPLFHFSDTWQLVINTGTTIITFLMVFLIQNTQNRDAQAMHLKLDELIKSTEGARNRLIEVEDLSDEALLHLRQQFRLLQERVASDPEMAHSAIEDIEDIQEDIEEEIEDREDSQEAERTQ